MKSKYVVANADDACVARWNIMQPATRRERLVGIHLHIPDITTTEMLEASISNTCPLAFSGVTGSLFAKAVTALVASHCTITDNYTWPKDNSNEIINNNIPITFDFIIVGAGTAGSIVSSRLTNINPSWSVLLVESGDDPSIDSEIPAFLIFNQNTSMDWNYKTHPNKKNCLGFKNNSCIWTKGKAMGGSSSINAMLYLRGHPNDYDQWSKENQGWSYSDLEPYFNKIENKFNLKDYKFVENPWYSIIKKAWNELGYLYNNGNDNIVKIGTRHTKLLVHKGKRLNTAKVYLIESLNLRVMKNTQVLKIIINPVTKVAVGVKIRHAGGNVKNIIANNEVILSAGSVASAQILMLSGIGPKRHLADKKVKCFVDLPVGQNLQDHVLLPILLTAKLNTILTPEIITSFFLEYMLSRTGPFSNLGITDFMGFIDTDDASHYPNIQFHHTYFPKHDSLMLKSYFERVGYEDEIIKSILMLNEESALLGIYPTLLHPKSRGSVLLDNANPRTKPVINANYLEHLDDIDTLVKAIDFVKDLLKTKSFQHLGMKLATFDIPGCSNFSIDTKPFWVCYIRHMATTIYHPVGTAKMGHNTDRTTVVDHDLKVHGVKNLRVVDASIMPFITSGNTMAPTLVIAEKAVEISKKKI